MIYKPTSQGFGTLIKFQKLSYREKHRAYSDAKARYARPCPGGRHAMYGYINRSRYDIYVFIYIYAQYIYMYKLCIYVRKIMSKCMKPLLNHFFCQCHLFWPQRRSIPLFLCYFPKKNVIPIFEQPEFHEVLRFSSFQLLDFCGS